MAADNRAYDGHVSVFGMDGDLDPSQLDATILSKAVNRNFRGGKNRTRPPFVHKPFVFNNSDDEKIVKYGNVQGAFMYRKTRAARVDCIVAAIAGYIFRFSLVNEKFQVDRIWSLNNAKLLHTWFVQAQDWLYIQNGYDKPVFWDGTLPSTARHSLWPEKPEMPIGTIMAYAFGRVFLADAFDQVAASDIIYGTGFTTTSNTQNFTENTYWNEGGSFGMPTNLGHVTGMTVTAAQSKGNLYGQGVVLILGDDGAQTLDASVSRDQWKNASIQSVVLVNQGCLAPGSVINVNNRTMFRSDDGMSVLQNLQYDQANALSFGKFSQAVNNWYDDDTASLIRYNSSIFSNNYVLSTVSPWTQANVANEWGNHRYHRGMVCLDLDRSAEKMTGKPLAWNGLWTGIRPTVMVSGKINNVKRAFAFSFDADGVNRIYEVAGGGINDEVNGRQVQTKWFYYTKAFDWSAAQVSNSFEMKKIVGGELHASELNDRVALNAAYRSDSREDWSELMADTLVGPALDGFNFSTPRWKRLKFLTPSDKCKKGEPNPAASGLQHQVMVGGHGSCQIKRVRIAMAPTGNEPNVPVGDEPTRADDPKIQYGLEGKIVDDYEYLIIPDATDLS